MTLASRKEIDWLGRKGALGGDSPLPQFGPKVPRYCEMQDDILLWSHWWDPRTEAPPSSGIAATARTIREPEKEADTAGMLDAFVRITNGDGVLSFAQRYGALDICEHRLPRTHNAFPFPVPVSWSACRPWAEPQYLVSAEPVDLWLGYVSQMRALLGLAVDIRSGSVGRAKDWRVAFSELLYYSDLQAKALRIVGQNLETDRSALSERVNAWLRVGDARPGLAWEGDSLASFHVFTSTFGILGIQLLFAATKAQGLSICDGCGMPYAPKRKPRKDRRKFCPACGERVASRLRKQKLRSTDKTKGSSR